jgi:hypothetical protein
LNYLPNTPAQVFVITTGGLGSDGIQSADQQGGVITFTFSTRCAVGRPTASSAWRPRRRRRLQP